MRHVMIFFIDIYRRLISPLFPSSCRFYPTCSTYAKEALMRFGFFRGMYLSIKRIVKCNPLCRGGFDPLPPRFHF